jgi:protease IV
MNAVINSTVAAVAADRKQAPDVVRATLEAGPYDAAGAKTKGLIDKLGQVEEMEHAALAVAGDGSDIVELDDYSGRIGLGSATGPVIAVINVEGAIMTGEAGSGSPFGEQTAYSDDIAGAIYDAVEDDGVKAIVMRVSSPGGSDTASEQIAAAIRAAKAAKKPVVVSMGSYAASGGYWISAEADYIVAQPTTLTGSIGVYGGKFSAGDAAARFGVDVRETTVGGEFASVGSIGHGFTPAQRAAYSAQIDRVYAAFLRHVAAGRKMPLERVREIAGGRVWTGVQAKQIGLVDQLGGLTDAVDKAKSLAGIKGAARLHMLPEPVSTLEALEQALGVSASGVRTLAAAGWILGDPRAQAAIERLAQERLRARGAKVLAPRVLP